jgi:hypothetical protein
MMGGAYASAATQTQKTARPPRRRSAPARPGEFRAEGPHGSAQRPQGDEPRDEIRGGGLTTSASKRCNPLHKGNQGTRKNVRPVPGAAPPVIARPFSVRIEPSRPTRRFLGPVCGTGRIA